MLLHAFQFYTCYFLSVLFALEDFPQWRFADLHGCPSVRVLILLLQLFIYFFKSLILEVSWPGGTSGLAVRELAARNRKIPWNWLQNFLCLCIVLENSLRQIFFFLLRMCIRKTCGEGQGGRGMDWEFENNRYTLLYIKPKIRGMTL